MARTVKTMAIFDKEKEFYSLPAPAFKQDQPLIYRLADFLIDRIFVVNIPVSILIVVAFGNHSRFTSAADNAIGILTGGSILYFFLGLLPFGLAALLASPTLLAWKTYKTILFRRTFDVIFVVMYFLTVLSALIEPLLLNKTK